MLLIACSDEQLNAFIDALSKPRVTVHFDFDVYGLNTEAKSEIDSLVYFLRTDSLPIVRIEIAGHCDSVGSNAYNDALSLKRAQTVKAYLVSKGIGDPVILSVKGYGKHMPVNSNQTVADRNDNRRAEILVQLKMPLKTDTLKVQLIPDTTTVKTIDISHAQVNDIIQLPDINFYPDRHLIIEKSMSALKILLNTMLVNKTLKIEIRGHVCCLPDYQGDSFDEDTYKEDLSVQRAREIYLYLSENGVEKDRMSYIGLGAKYPLVKEFSEHDKALNRRVEVKILSK